MRTLWTITLVLVSLGWCFGQQQSAANATKPDDGSFTDGVYRNSYFGLSYSVGTDWFSNEQMTTPAERAKFNRLPGSFLLAILDRHNGTQLRDRILLLADDSSKYTKYKEIGPYLDRHLAAHSLRPGVTIAHSTHVVEYSGRKFYRGDYTETAEGVSLYKSYVCTSTKGYFLCWTFVAGSQENLNSLVDTLKQATFTP